MTKIDDHLRCLRELSEWVPYLLEHSGLPGPRGNLELVYAVAEAGDIKQFEQFLTVEADENTPEVFVLFCGIVGLGRLSVRQPDLFNRLRPYASDPRWRIREAVATGLQLAGDQDMELLLQEMKTWIQGNGYEKRAAAAALAEPRLLKEEKHAQQALQILDQITASMESGERSRDDSFKVLKQGMAYCWSVAVAALPETGKPLMEKWLDSTDKEILWVMKENLKKNRLVKMDAAWVEKCTKRLR
jgi:hypothetical protein